MLEANAQVAGQEIETTVAPNDRVQLAMKVQIGEAGTFEGMASVLGSIAHGAKGPVTFKQGAFRETLAEKAGVFPLLWQHADDQPIGKIVLSETSEGLSAKGFITQNTRGQEITALLRDGVPLGLSIGFNPVQAAYEKHADGSLVRCVSKANVKETSIVTFPADQAAQIRIVHSAVGTMVAKSVTENDRAWVEGAIAEIMGDDAPEEIHAGRVFSASNLSRMKTVAESLLELIALAEHDYPAALIAKFSPSVEAPVESVTGPEEIAQAHALLKLQAFKRSMDIELVEAESYLKLGAPAGHPFYGNQHVGEGGGGAGAKDAGAKVDSHDNASDIFEADEHDRWSKTPEGKQRLAVIKEVNEHPEVKALSDRRDALVEAGGPEFRAVQDKYMAKSREIEDKVYKRLDDEAKRDKASPFDRAMSEPDVSAKAAKVRELRSKWEAAENGGTPIARRVAKDAMYKASKEFNDAYKEAYKRNGGGTKDVSAGVKSFADAIEAEANRNRKR
jgi:HK97 family phage prohead protease